MHYSIRSAALPTVFACLLIVGAEAQATSGSDPVEARPIKSDSASKNSGNPPGRQDAAATKFWLAIKLLRSSKPADLAAGRTALQQASDMEYGHAQVLLANCYMAGSYGYPKNVRKGANLYQLAAEHGNGFAQVSFGQCLFLGSGVGKNIDQAERWLTAALAPAADYSRPAPPPESAGENAPVNETGGVAGDLLRDPVSGTQASAHFLLGQIYANRKKLPEAQAQFVAAASAGPGGRDGIAQAALQAALNYAFGNGVDRDLAKAREMIEQSRKLAGRMGVSVIHNYVALKMVDEFATADLEESISKAGEAMESELQVKIAQSFANKKSKDYNLAEATKWYELAAESNQAWAMLELGLIYSSGGLGAPDWNKAFVWFEKAGGGEVPRHLLGVANLAICYRQGLGTGKDEERARALFEKHQQDLFLCYLGTIGHEPAVPQTYDDSMKLLESWAKEKHDPHAQYFMGLRFMGGWDKPVDREEATKWFKLAAKSDIPAAYFQLGILAEKFSVYISDSGTRQLQFPSQESLDLYKKASDLGDTNAMVNYALNLVQQNGPEREKNLAMAEALNLKCLQISPNNVWAHNNIAVIYENRLAEAIRRNDTAVSAELRQKMLEHYTTAARLKSPLAARNLGQLYRQGRLVDRDYRRAYSYLEQAAEGNQTGVHYQLGQMNELGEGIPVTLAEAAYHYRLAALEGDMTALNRLVDFYVDGKGVSQDVDRALFWIGQLARRSSTRTVTRLGDRFMRQGKFEIADRLFELLAGATDPETRGLAHERLGLLYFNGWGVGKDLAESQRHREKAIADGNLPAMHDTAIALMSEGRKKEGFGYLEKAAKRGLADSQFKLGSMYLAGDEVAKDLKRGVKWLGAAATQGMPAAELAYARLTVDKISGAPDLATALKMAGNALTDGQPNAKEVVEQLQQLQKK